MKKTCDIATVKKINEEDLLKVSRINVTPSSDRVEPELKHHHE